MKLYSEYLFCTFLFNIKHLFLGTYQLIKYYSMIVLEDKLSLFRCLLLYWYLCISNRLTFTEFIEFRMFDKGSSIKKKKECLPSGLQEKYFFKTFDNYYDILLNNKNIFSVLCRGFNIPTPRTIGVISLDGFDNLSSKCASCLMDIFEEITTYPVILKPSYGLCGKNIEKICGFDKYRRMVKLSNGEKNIELLTVEMVKSGFKEFIIQDYIEQHEMLRSISENAVNTIRVQTFIQNKNVYIAGAMLKIGIGNTCVDNVGSNQFVSLIDLGSGELLRTIRILSHSIPDIIKGDFIIEQNKHPETGAQITGCIIPFWNEVKNLSIYCSQKFGMFNSIGWDIAIADNGPIILEGNVAWTAKYQQLLAGGIYKDTIKELIDDGIKCKRKAKK